MLIVFHRKRKFTFNSTYAYQRETEQNLHDSHRSVSPFVSRSIYDKLSTEVLSDEDHVITGFIDLVGMLVKGKN